MITFFLTFFVFLPAAIACLILLCSLLTVLLHDEDFDQEEYFAKKEENPFSSAHPAEIVDLAPLSFEPKYYSYFEPPRS